METTERIDVFVLIEHGKTVCICKRDNKCCRRHCEKAVVERDKYEGWKDTFQQNRFGKNPKCDKWNENP